MNAPLSYILEGTLAMVLLTLVITHPSAFSTIISAGGSTLTGGVQALWAAGIPDAKGSK